MRIRTATVAPFVLLVLSVASAETRDFVIDPLVSAENWQVGGRRVNYTLGASAVQASAEQTHGGAASSLKLTYDFADPNRDYLSYYHLGDAIPGRCEAVSFWLWGDASGCRLVLSLQDARDRWFEREVGVVDWSGWREVSVPVGDGQGWRPLLRRGEPPLPLLPPVNLRQVAFHRSSPQQPSGAVYIQDLRARSDVAAGDLVTAEFSTGRTGNLFDLGETPEVVVDLVSGAPAAIDGHLSARISDFFGPVEDVGLGLVSLAPGATERRTVRSTSARLGTHQVQVTLSAGGRERVWFTRFAVVRPREEEPLGPDSLFGCCFTLSGFSAEQIAAVLRLNRDAGIRWERTGFSWGEVNPAPGRWAWDEPTTIAGPVGRALELGGQALRVPHSDALTIRDAVTIALWARPQGANGQWQTLVAKWGAANERNYGLYLHRANGNLCFSASYAGYPDHGWDDVDSGFSGWDGEWHHYVATYSREAKEVALYVDGRLRMAQEWDGGELRTNGDDLLLGGGYSGGLDEVVVCDRALTSDEVAVLARKERPREEGLVAWWSFDDAGGTLRDRSPNRLDIVAREPYGAEVARMGLGHGIKTLGILGFPPDWASTAEKGAGRPWVYKPDLAAWAEFVENTTRHYRDLVQHWEIWNEPNIAVFWEPQPSAAEYFDVLRAGYEAAKRGNPECRVLMPGLAGPLQGRWGMDFLDELLQLGAARYCDAISIHPYRQATPEESDLAGDLQHIADLAEANGGRRPIWFTEDCWTTDLPGGSTEERAALMLPRCYALALGTGLMERFVWFRLADPGVDRFYGEDNYGLCYHDLTPKPAYFAHATTAALLDGGTPEPAWDFGPRAMGRVFETARGRVAAVWSTQGEVPVAIRLGRAEATLVDLMGNESTVPTRDGTLILRATEAATFIRDVPQGAHVEGVLLSVSDAIVPRGASERLTVTVRNPFASPRRAIISVTPPRGVSLDRDRVEISVAARSSQDVPFEASVASDAATGWAGLRVALRLGREDFWEDARLGVRSAAADAGPVGYWRFDEGRGTAIADSSPNGNDGVVEAPVWVEGKRGMALQFDTQHIATVPDSPSLNLRDEVTVAFWLKLLADTGTWQFPVAKYQQENVRRNYGIYIHKDTLAPCFSASFEGGSYAHSDVPSTQSVNDGQWHHLAATYSVFDERVRLYIDGRLAVDQAHSEGAMLLTSDPLRIGVGTSGAIDEVMLFPRALSADEVAALAE